MSLLLGLIYLDEKNVDDSCMEKMLEPLRKFPNENIKITQNKEAVFAKVLTYGTVEDVYDILPLFLSESNMLFVSIGRIDNRDELIPDLSLSKQDEMSDSFIMLQAYLKYGDQVQFHLKGDWSLVAYHYDTKKLFITRDTMGYTSLFYYQTEEYFAFSSSIKSILNLPGQRIGLNEEYYISYLTIWRFEEKIDTGVTFHQDVYYLPNGHSLCLTNRNKTIQKYWPLTQVNEIHYKNPQNYIDEFLEIFQVAVQRRLRSYKPVASMLSGGLDSSSVSVIAAELLKKQGQTLSTYSHIPFYKEFLLNNPLARIRELDEYSNIKAIVEHSGNIKPKYLSSSDFSPFKGMEMGLEILDGPVHGASNLYWIIDLFTSCAQDGFGTVLTGEGGNGSISYTGVDYLLPHSMERLVNQPFQYVKSQVIKPIVFNYFKRFWFRKNPELFKYIQSMYLNQSVLDSFDMIQDIEKNQFNFQIIHSTAYEAKIRLNQLYTPRSLSGAAWGQYFGIELRDPTCDIDVMNYFFKIPNDVFVDSHYQFRMLIKKMMRNKLPEQVLFANKKGLQSSDLTPRILHHEKDMFPIMDSIKNNALANQYFNTKQLMEDLPIFHAKLEKGSAFEKQQKILKTMQFAHFLKKFD
ncbi:asparagine synthetase B family protein [Cytophagaceae bacterium 50C-KIRBA]|uniref:asparagine synthase (glutamine-hydrolyzing) n=1 Tax=Aquirufa beregesia TaxID=2516556 RepID=A0ABX0F470_9BACT|nr:asparagine synthetase B family protein [Aquirufa beregesia]NGZ44655.1 asparagine synthetase B family protein [Aquirufa beregesia]